MKIVAHALLFLALTGAAAQAATCFVCDSSGGYPSCADTSLGAEVCVTLSDPPFCETYFNDCSSGCIPCPGGCCASLKDHKQESCQVKKMSWQESGTINPQPRTDHLQEFLDMVEKGVFDKKIIYTSPSSSIGKGLMDLPVDHWKSFKVVMKGAEDYGIKPAKKLADKPQTVLEIETKSGHKLVVHLVGDSTMKKLQKSPQPHSQPDPTQNPAMKDKSL
jgi:hypothetical protein